jgi:hypothetical protein
MNITIKPIPHDEQRYPTVGDWVYDNDGNLIIVVSDMGDWKLNALVGLHELVEVLLCKNDGVTQKQVDDFDIDYESKRKPGDESEPGDSPDAPYQSQHCIATGFERVMAAELGVKWEEYEAKINSL